MTETFTERVARMKRLGQTLKPGSRVIVPQTGRTGTIVRRLAHHSGWLVRWDDPKFGVIEGRVATAHLEMFDH